MLGGSPAKQATLQAQARYWAARAVITYVVRLYMCMSVSTDAAARADDINNYNGSVTSARLSRGTRTVRDVDDLSTVHGDVAPPSPRSQDDITSAAHASDEAEAEGGTDGERDQLELTTERSATASAASKTPSAAATPVTTPAATPAAQSTKQHTAYSVSAAAHSGGLTHTASQSVHFDEEAKFILKYTGKYTRDGQTLTTVDKVYLWCSSELERDEVKVCVRLVCMAQCPSFFITL